MAVRGELYTTEIHLANRSYFFNVKENRNGDVFLQVVESKNREGGPDFDRHQIAVFAEDMQQFFQGLEKSLSFIEKDRKARKKKAEEKKAAKEAKYRDGEKVIYRKTTGEKLEDAKEAERRAKEEREAWREKRQSDGIKRTGKVIHVVSKRTTSSSENN